MKNLRKFIKNNEKIYFIARVLQQFRNPDFRKRVIDLTDSPSTVKVESLGEKNPDKLFYLIDIDDSGGPSGLFALLNDTVKRLELARRLGATPYVRFVNTSYYPEGNAFERYFLQLSDISYEDILQSQNVIKSKIQDGFERDDSQVYYEKDGFLQAIGALYKKYIHLQPEISERLESDIKTSGMAGELENSIGIHFRGTDFRQSLIGHPQYVSYDDYVNAVRELRGGYKNIFICTDDENALKYFQNAFQNDFSKILFYQNTMRSTGDIGLHYAVLKNPVHDKDIGYEVIRDVYSLARCRVLLAGVSNVSFSARAINASGEKTFEFCKILNHGLNSSGITSKVFNENFVKS